MDYKGNIIFRFLTFINKKKLNFIQKNHHGKYILLKISYLKNEELYKNPQ